MDIRQFNSKYKEGDTIKLIGEDSLITILAIDKGTFVGVNSNGIEKMISIENGAFDLTPKEIQVEQYKVKNDSRKSKIVEATVGLVGYFMLLGDDKTTSQGKVKQISTELAPFIYVYILGNTEPLINCINNSQLDFMTVEAKSFLINELTV